MNLLFADIWPKLMAECGDCSGIVEESLRIIKSLGMIDWKSKKGEQLKPKIDKISRRARSTNYVIPKHSEVLPGRILERFLIRRNEKVEVVPALSLVWMTGQNIVIWSHLHQEDAMWFQLQEG